MAISTESDMSPPVFIHSLFRAGSTYLFNVFRRSEAGYYCYQEPLHEMAVIAKDNPNDLMVNFGDHEAAINRHPKLERPYFQELFEAWPAWQDSIKEQFVFQSYFANDASEIGIEYWQALASAAKGRPVFQECRTSGRIQAIQNHFNALHLYLWRNPWDQWWSYKINDYFEAANQLIVHAVNPPAALKLMLQDLALPRYSQDDIPGAIAYYKARPLTTEESYLIFYMVWCFALREGSAYADQSINIDRLSDSIEYKNEVETKLQQLGIEGLVFSDSRVSQGVYSEKDIGFFHAAESRVHLWLLEGGWKQSEIDAIQELREKFSPKLWTHSVESLKPEGLVEQVGRLSQLAKRFETANAAATGKLEESLAKVQQMKSVVADAVAREHQTQNHLSQALTALQQAQTFTKQAEEKAAQQLGDLNRQLEATRLDLHKANQANDYHWQQLRAVYTSKSWRITAPLRWPVQQIRLLREHGLKNRTKAFIKKILRKINRYLLARPSLHRWLLRLSKRLGLYKTLKKLRDHLRQPTVDINQSNPAFPACHQFAELSPQARRIYKKLKKLIDAKKGGDNADCD